MGDAIQFVLSVYVERRIVDIVRRPGVHEQPNVATRSLSLHKSLAGIPSLFGPVPESVALSVTNEYKDLKWPGSDEGMSLVGTAKDRKHILEFLEKFGFTTGVKLERINNALRRNVQDRVKKIISSHPPLLVVHFQGHGIRIRNTVQYITEDQKDDSTLDGLTAEEMIEMFSKLTFCTISLVITDFCHSGNLYRLRFQLVIGEDGLPSWYETQEWRYNKKCNQKVEIVSPMLHIAGSLRWQQVYETKRRGGYLTNSLAQLETKPTTLPQFLIDLRKGVNGHLDAANANAKLDPLAQTMFQDPQIFSSHMWALDDPQILSKLRLGMAKPSSSISG
ncbi:unnamed protein product [Rhizoctonia solani]|uniref:Peptidase C14 caspase domain-containing protein n=1 Tax=Rhizoctonia solani TaxID=456999 RepID=A0A8H3AKQ2_9AGAM|nr:unnamed protein product [Rhizoctonia solani]